MKLKRRRKPTEPDQELESFRTVRGPHKGHATHNYFAVPKLTKAQRARRRAQLREKYGPDPGEATPTSHMSTEQRRLVRAEVLAAAGHRCEACGNPRRLTIDHVVPRHIGGGNHRENLQCLCEPCNKAKGLDIWKASDGTTPTLFL